MAFPADYYKNPALAVERRDNLRGCPGCQFNEVAKVTRGWRTYKCGWGHDQQGGTRTKENCPDWRAK